MAYLAKGKKCDLIELAIELGQSIPPDSKITDLKTIITKSPEYDEPFVKELLTRIIEERVKQEEITEREKERQFELQKLEIENRNKINLQTEINDSETENKKNTIDLRNLIQKFDLKDGDIASFLIIFERQAKRVGIKEDDYVAHLLGLLPLDIIQLIAREPEQEASKYAFVKNLLLKRYKLSPESFRQKFFNHVKDSKSTWSDFVFELRTYFNEWLMGLNIVDFESLKELIITDQLKRRVPSMIREHFIDLWPKFTKASELAEKLDDYDNVRSGIRTKNSKNVNYYEEQKLYPYANYKNANRCHDKTDFPKPDYKNLNVRKMNSREVVNPNQFNAIKNEKSDPKCFSCNELGHISKDYTHPCKKCAEREHVKKNFFVK